MRSLFILLLTSFLLFSCGNVAISDFTAYPKLKTIVERLDDEYKIRRNTKISFTVAKKPKGWFVVKTNNETTKPVGEELFWASDSKSFVKIPRDFFNSPGADGDFVKMSREMRGRDYSYDHSIYFGYDNWEEDAIGVLEVAGNLNDTLTEALARAYASKCIMISRPEKNATTKRSGKLTDEQVKDFCSYGNKGIETYKKLLAMNPEYETIVGKVQTKLSNEYLFLWSELKQAGRDKDAEQFLVSDLYDDLMINFAKNMLNGADKNAIIFTNGDNDTYPLWYAQEKLGVRKDIAVMNTSLMNIPNWIFSDKNKYRFDMQISEKVYFDSFTDVLYLERGSEKTYGMETVKNGIENKNPEFLGEAASGSILQLPCNNIRLSYQDGDSFAPVAHLNASYLFKSDLAALDIISSNLGKRPIYFAQTAGYGTLTNALENKLSNEGLLLKVIQGENKGQSSGGKYYNADLFYANYTANFNFGFDNLKSLQVEQMGANYIYNFNYLCSIMLENGDTAKAIKAAEACVNKIPFKLFSDPVGPYLMGDNFCRAGKTEEGKKLFVLSIEKMKVSYINKTDNNDLMRDISILGRIIDTSEKNGFRELVSSATKLKEKINEKIQRQGGMQETLRYNGN